MSNAKFHLHLTIKLWAQINFQKSFEICSKFGDDLRWWLSLTHFITLLFSKLTDMLVLMHLPCTARDQKGVGVGLIDKHPFDNYSLHYNLKRLSSMLVVGIRTEKELAVSTMGVCHWKLISINFFLPSSRGLPTVRRWQRRLHHKTRNVQHSGRHLSNGGKFSFGWLAINIYI